MTSVADRALLGLLILTWAISWPVIKVGVSTVPPIWYGCLRFTIAALCLFAFVSLRGTLAIPSRGDWPLIAISGSLQMAAFAALTGLALTVLPPGRASVLAYTTPLWVVPLAAWWLHERPTRSEMIGVGIGLPGVLAIATPSLSPDGREQILAYAMLMGAAAAWAVSIVYVRSHQFVATALVLAPWQMLVAAALLLPAAMVFEGAAPAIEASGAASLSYVGPIGTAFAYWAVVESGRRFRAGTISMALLATPTLGVLISALTLGERIGPSLVVGVLLIGAGIALGASARAPQTTP